MSPRLAVRGWGPWRQEWYSICSAHQNGGPDDECQLCRAGLWRNCWRQFFGHIVYKRWPRLWRWWANR
jgi:hypothetical protein